MLTSLRYVLTPEQREAIADAEIAAWEATQAGRPGIILAQILDGQALVAFIEHERAAQIVRIVGGEPNRIVSKVEKVDGTQPLAAQSITSVLRPPPEAPRSTTTRTSGRTQKKTSTKNPH